MTHPSRVIPALLCTLWGWVVLTPSTLRAADGLSPELAAYLASRPTWSVTTGADLSLGYRDNLLRSSTSEERSPLVRASVDMLLLRLAGGKLDFSIFGQAERTHFSEGETVDHEAQAWVLSEASVALTPTVKLSLPVTGYYYDQAFDASVTELRRDIAELKVNGLISGPVLRWQWSPVAWVETQVAGERKRYEDGLNDSRISDLALRTGRNMGDAVKVSVGFNERWRDFDSRLQYSAAGRELTDTQLKVREREGEMRLEWTFGQERQWTLTTRGGHLRYRDNGSGYFDHRRTRVGVDLEWSRGAWTFALSGLAERTDFELQTVGVAIDPPGLLAEDFAADLRLEYQLGSEWTLFSAYSWERRRSNDPIAGYRMNEGLLGVRWSWER